MVKYTSEDQPLPPIYRPLLPSLEQVSPLLMTFAGLSPALLERYEKPWDPCTLRLETMDLSDGTLEARGGGGICGRDGQLPRLHFPGSTCLQH